MAFSIHGVRVPHRKDTESSPAVRITPPKSVTLPTVMHIGAPAVPVVKVGDTVSVGTLVAQQNGFISSPVYSSVSGKVTKITDMLASNGTYVPAIVIESDGLFTPAEVTAPVINSKQDFIDAVRDSGVVGLGGAGFPTYVKLMTDKHIDELIINATECEPYITSDTRTLIDNADDLAEGIDLIAKYLGIEKFIIGIEKGCKESIDKMKALAEKDKRVSVKVLPSRYPQGGEKVLVFNTTGKVIKSGQLPADVGCIVCNCTTVAFIARYIRTGMPLVEKTVTVDGGAVKEPKNVIAPIGTPIGELFDFCGGFTLEPSKILYGGPMMGISVPDTSAPVLKQTNAVLALSAKESRKPTETACIRCGTCANTCPLGIDPAAIAKAFETGNHEILGKLGIEVCMECGCCSFNCPASRNLVQINKMAKAAWRNYKINQEKEAEKNGK